MRGIMLCGAIALFIAWTLATWLLEGRIDTLLQGAALADRLTYTLLANVVIGIVGGVLAPRFLIRRNARAHTLPRSARERCRRYG